MIDVQAIGEAFSHQKRTSSTLKQEILHYSAFVGHFSGSSRPKSMRIRILNTGFVWQVDAKCIFESRGLEPVPTIANNIDLNRSIFLLNWLSSSFRPCTLKCVEFVQCAARGTRPAPGWPTTTTTLTRAGWTQTPTPASRYTNKPS